MRISQSSILILVTFVNRWFVFLSTKSCVCVCVCGNSVVWTLNHLLIVALAIVKYFFIECFAMQIQFSYHNNPIWKDRSPHPRNTTDLICNMWWTMLFPSMNLLASFLPLTLSFNRTTTGMNEWTMQDCVCCWLSMME